MKNTKKIFITKIVVFLIIIAVSGIFLFRYFLNDGEFKKWSHATMTRSGFEDQKVLYLSYNFTWEGTGQPTIKNIMIFKNDGTMAEENDPEISITPYLAYQSSIGVLNEDNAIREGYVEKLHPVSNFHLKEDDFVLILKVQLKDPHYAGDIASIKIVYEKWGVEKHQSIDFVEGVITDEADGDEELKTERETESILSRNFIDINGDQKEEIVQLVMSEGEYFEEKDPGAFQGGNWKGIFVLEVFDHQGNKISEYLLNKSFGNEMLLFRDPFPIYFQDYNQDGNLEFLIGQYVSSNGSSYKMFSVNEKGKVSPVGIWEKTSNGFQGNPYLYISSSKPSVELKQPEPGNITWQFYDQTKGEYMTRTAVWNEKKKAFIRQLKDKKPGN